MTMGKGTIQSTSKKQKINTWSSTKAELVSSDDVIAQILWTRHFLEEQGYEVTDNINHEMLSKIKEMTADINVIWHKYSEALKKKE